MKETELLRYLMESMDVTIGESSNELGDWHEVKDMFKQMFPITKDLSGIRVKGTMQEDIVEAIQSAYPMSELASWREQPTGKPGYMGCQSYLEASDDQTIGIFSMSCSMGIPSYVVGVQDKQTWLNLRKQLQSQGLLR